MTFASRQEEGREAERVTDIDIHLVLDEAPDQWGQSTAGRRVEQGAATVARGVERCAT